MQPLVSVIIPVYNRENTIRRCMDSILQQNYQNMEILLVDDGSSDETGTICDKYAAQDGRVSVFHNVNHGVSYSRNFALGRSNGKYVTFVDSDDYISQQYIRHLVEKAENGGFDLVVSPMKWKWKGKEDDFDMTNTMASGRISDDYYTLQKFMGGVVAKLFSAHVLDTYHIRFHEDMAYSEDRVFNIEYDSHITNYGMVTDCSYICDYSQDDSFSHLSHTRPEGAYRSEIKKIRIEKSFLEKYHICHADLLMSDAIVGTMNTFVVLHGEEPDYGSFCRRVHEIRSILGAMKTASNWKRRLVMICYNFGVLYPIYWYYRSKQV